MAEVKLDVVELEANIPLEVDDQLEAVAEDGNYWLLKGTNILFVNNGSDSPITVTMKMVGESNTGEVDDVAQAVPAGELWMFNPSDHWRFADTVGSYLHVTYSSHTTVTAAMIRIGHASH